MATTVLTRKEIKDNFVTGNGYTESFLSKELNRKTRKLYEYQATGELALWDMAEVLYEISDMITEDPDAFAEDGIKSFKDYCNAIDVNYSNYTRYIKAYKEYYPLKEYGFSIGTAVALLHSGLSAEDIIQNYTPKALTVKMARTLKCICMQDPDEQTEQEDPDEQTEQEDPDEQTEQDDLDEQTEQDDLDEQTKQEDPDEQKITLSYKMLLGIIESIIEVHEYRPIDTPAELLNEQLRIKGIK